MKLTTVILVTAILQVSASAYSQKITLSERNTSLNKIFEKISNQTGYDFLVSTENLKEAKLVTINVRNEELKAVLDKIFTGQPLNYVVQEKMVVVSKKEAPAVEDVSLIIKTPITISGIVTDTTGLPMPGATIRIKGTNKIVLTGPDGRFSIAAQPGDELNVSFVGYESFSLIINNVTAFQKVILHLVSSKLNEVNVISNGYQTLPKERATGSFTQIDNTLINRSVSTNILDRLNGVTTGLIFNNNGNHQFGQSNIEIRGRGTLFSNSNPLIVLDNFQFDGDLNNINPNDVESITVLKDAAAASAWGSRSGNGVIVITTKKGKLNSATTVSFNANTTIGEKPNLFYAPQLTSAQYIDVEQFLFNHGAYNNTISNDYSALSPAVEIFQAKRSGSISVPDSLSRINALKGLDTRNQLLKYVYRPSVNQQYQAGISGGTATQKYFVSAGYDKNLDNLVNNNYQRVTLNASNTYYFLKNRLEFFSNIIYTGTTTKSTPVQTQYQYPYDQIADANGNPLAVANNLRLSYASAAGNGKLLNWLYMPLSELNNGYSTAITSQTDYRINLSMSYKIIKGLQAKALYNYERGITESNTLNELQSYYTRNLINTFTQINSTTGAITYPIPLGGILNNRQTDLKSNDGRLQLNYENTWGKHTVNVILGGEVDDYESFVSNYVLYGYNSETATNLNSAINYTIDFPYFYNSATGRIGPNSSQLGTSNRFFSEYFNGSYIFDDRYLASLSARRDESNLFGVSENQKGVPLWSAGLAWILNKESFYRLDWLPQLKIRATYGYTGNVNTSISAYLTAIRSTLAQTYNVPSNQIINPPNPSLRWEKDQNINIGVDFGTKNNHLNGSLEFWRKNGMDLIGNSPIAPQTGINLYTGNSANTSTNGIDLQLNSINLNGKFKWLTTLLYNQVKSLVTTYKVSNGTNYNVVSANYNNPLQGYPYYAIFSFKYAGLTPTGDPQGYLNGKISTDYSGIMNATNRQELVYNGSATPTSFGGFRNTFSYKAFDLSVNITYKIGYYFRRSSLSNGLLYSGQGNNYQMADYENRWQKPGDEFRTNVPALIYPADINRDNLYIYSNSLVVKGDNIRLQDFRLGYTFGNRSHLPFKSLSVYTYVNNIGILWRANKYHIDPDFPFGTGYPVPRTIALGIKADL